MFASTDEKNNEWVTKEIDYRSEEGVTYYNLYLMDQTNFLSCCETVVDRFTRAIRYFKIRQKGQLLNANRSLITIFKMAGDFKL